MHVDIILYWLRCGPGGVECDLSVFPGGVATVAGVTLLATVVGVVGVVGVPLPPAIVSINITQCWSV